MNAPSETKLHWLVRPATIRLLWIIFAAVLAVLTALDIFRHGHGPALEHSFGFYSWYGFLACVAMVLAAKGLGLWLKRRDDYYS